MQPDCGWRLLAGFQVTSVELIKVSNGGIVIPVATVETQSSSGGSGISGGAIGGIVVGVIGGLALVGRKPSLTQPMVFSCAPRRSCKVTS